MSPSTAQSGDASQTYVVVDGSNIATEGRSIPSLAQLDEAVRQFMVERPADQVIVVVDASFGYRIDESERAEYEAAEAAGEIVSPPAGALGRGDGFLLRIADRTDAVVLSNDSFQEFHAEYPWLFDQGRLIGGKPVPGVGWIFTPRAPVRGPRSREAIRAAKKAQKAALKRAAVADGPVAAAIAAATAEAIAPDDASPSPAVEGDGDDGKSTRSGRSRRRRTKPVGTVNDPLPFIEFIAEHPLGSVVDGEVEGFTSHGAFVSVAGARCYVPLVALGDPPPRSAKSVLKKGETRPFVVQALDPPRRGIELALPELARVAGTPTEETVEADIGAGRKARRGAAARAAPEEAAANPEAAREEAATATEAAPEEAAASSDAAEAPAGPEPAPEAGPPRRRRTRKKAAATVEAQAVEAHAVEAPAAEAPAEPRPEEAPVEVPARPSRRRRSKAAPDVETEAPPAAEAPPSPEPETAPAPPPARARRSRKVPAEAPPSRGATAPEHELPEPALPGGESAPPRPRRARAAKKAPEAAAAVPEPEPAPAETAPAPAPAKRARKSTKKATADGDEPAPAPAAKKAAKRASATRARPSAD